MTHRADPCTRRRQALRQLGALGVGMALGAAGPGHAATARGDAPLPAEVALSLPQARLQGDSRFRYFGFHVYDAQLWVPPAFDAARPFGQRFALCLLYARPLKARDIAERSLQEMRRQTDIGEAEAQRWLQAMVAAFADVRRGDRLTGVFQGDRGASFFLNGQATRSIDDQRFAALFFGIWLSPATSAPGLRRDLLGV